MPKRSRKPKPPTDLNQLAKAIVDRATGQEPEQEPVKPEDDDEAARKAAARLLGSRGGKKGGRARAESLTSKRRSDIASKASRARWDAWKAKRAPTD